MKQIHTKENIHQQNKLAIFMNVGHEIQQITKIFKDSDTRIFISVTNKITNERNVLCSPKSNIRHHI
jgi:hypothetical protein